MQSASLDPNSQPADLVEDGSGFRVTPIIESSHGEYQVGLDPVRGSSIRGSFRYTAVQTSVSVLLTVVIHPGDPASRRKLPSE